jgi:hypothetical protein
MAKWILILLFGLSFSAAAESTMWSDPELGDVVMSVQDVGEPVYNPLLFKIKLKCKNAVRAKVIARMKICKLGDHKFDGTTKKLFVTLTVAADEPGDAPCTQVHNEFFDLKYYCSARR